MKHRRMLREEKTIFAMIKLYCDHHHHNNEAQLCRSCDQSYEYAIKRLQACPFQENKPTCTNCLIHCYNIEMREKIRAIMRYSGPRLTFKHPILAICHILDGRVKPMKIDTKKKSNN